MIWDRKIPLDCTEKLGYIMEETRTNTRDLLPYFAIPREFGILTEG